MKSDCIRSYFGPHFPAFGLNTERYGVELNFEKSNNNNNNNNNLKIKKTSAQIAVNFSVLPKLVYTSTKFQICHTSKF